MISYIDFTKLRAIILSNLQGFDESRTPLTSPIESRDLATQDQPGKGFAAPWRLAFSVVLRADFPAWASPSANLAER